MTPHVRNYFKKDLLNLFKGLKYEIVHYQGVYPGLSKLQTRFPSIGKILKGILRIFEKSPLHIFGLSHFIIIKKIK